MYKSWKIEPSNFFLTQPSHEIRTSNMTLLSLDPSFPQNSKIYWEMFLSYIKWKEVWHSLGQKIENQILPGRNNSSAFLLDPWKKKKIAFDETIKLFHVFF